ncbi:MAG: N-succinylarginine dihydrolase [Pseudomonadota bacterium]|nr:succinylarginine dihydrolase [Pseudomonadales bacterium]MDY6919495.1 N-succinylarginine dihydrolase [Pseudomonadota bacterium]
MPWREVNFDGLVGPTHHYGGLAPGNLASARHGGQVSNPRQAALQGLAKMRWMLDRGLPQGVLPPQLRPNLGALRQLGFQGPPQRLLAQAWQQEPTLFSAACSASAMWVANAATVIPSCDHPQQRCVLIPANLISHLHRQLEVAATYDLLRHVFASRDHFQVARPLPGVAALGDEGAANHMRIPVPGAGALHVFVYGRDGDDVTGPRRYPARQTRHACEALARAGNLDPKRVLYWQQLPDAIDAGVFHNDVIALSHTGVLLCHERAFVDQPQCLQQLQARAGGKLRIVQVPEQAISLQRAVDSYLFNSQLLGPVDHPMLVLPLEAERDAQVRQYVEVELRRALRLREVVYMDLRQSMSNGGGPACLRLRITLHESELNALQGRLLLNDERHRQLVQLVERRYPESLTLEQLSHWPTAREMMDIVAEIYGVLDLPTRLLERFQ